MSSFILSLNKKLGIQIKHSKTQRTICSQQSNMVCIQFDQFLSCSSDRFLNLKFQAASRKHLHIGVIPDLHIAYSKKGGNLGLVLNDKKW